MKPCDIVVGIDEVPSAFIREVLLKIHVYREVVGSFILTSLFVQVESIQEVEKLQEV